MAEINYGYAMINTKGQNGTKPARFFLQESIKPSVSETRNLLSLIAIL